MIRDVWTDEWNQNRASGRSLDAMRRIALDAAPIAEDSQQLEQYARRNQLTVHEMVYYLNAYQYGSDEGLEAIRCPDIIPVDTARRAGRTLASLLDEHLGGLVPCRVTDEGTALGVYQVQRRTNGDTYLFSICQFRLTVASHHWHLYWRRKFNAWWPYPLPQAGRRFTLKARLQQVLDDEYGCFWG